jgi:hypothetical protein
MTLEEELSQLPELKSIGIALVDFSEALIGGTKFELEGRRWVARPENFVTFEIHWQRTQNITLSLRGRPEEFLSHAEFPALQLTEGMAGYSGCKIESASQLAAAAYYIAKAAALYQAGSKRTRTQPRIIG